jgi:2'-5' RNA ligase
VRCFVAIELDHAVRDALSRLLAAGRRFADGVRWCTAEQLHVTLRFLGDVADGDLKPVCDAVAQASAGRAPFPLRLTGLGCFPSPSRPRVLWAGVDDGGVCGSWLGAADRRFAELGFAPEERSFHPHVTLARSKSPAGARMLQRALPELPAPREAAMLVRCITLFESRLEPGGARYLPAFTAPLDG